MFGYHSQLIYQLEPRKLLLIPLSNNSWITDHASLQVLEHKENHAPDFLCLCGRIYKDKFVESGHKDVESRDKSIEW